MAIRWEPASPEELARRVQKMERARARSDDGTFKGDDPATEANEAWVEKPTKKAKKKDAK